MESNRDEQIVFRQPRLFDERQKLAKILVDRLKYRLPVAVDPMDGRAEKAFAAWPERIYVIGTDGRVVYKAAPGPFGFKPEQAERRLARYVGRSSPS